MSIDDLDVLRVPGSPRLGLEQRANRLFDETGAVAVAACRAIASTTRGWQCPTDGTLL